MTVSHELLRLKLAESLAAEAPGLTRRDVRLPGIPGKAFAVIGVRRGGKTSFLAQCRADRLGAGGMSVYLDEVKTVPGWEGLVRRLMDEGGIELFVSGSSAKLLSREVAT